jgi:TonB family protein
MISSLPTDAPAVYPVWEPGLTLPVALPERIKPDYPPIGRVLGQEGIVMLTAVITEEGRVENIGVLRAPSPDPGFTEKAIEAVSQWL